MRNVYTATVISFLAAYVIKRVLIYLVSVSISVAYVFTALLSGSQVLIENIFAVVFCAICHCFCSGQLY